MTSAEVVANRYRRSAEVAFKKASVKMTSHRFRHYFISTTLATGVSVEDVSALVGTSPNEIRKTYRHYIKEAVDRLDRVQEQAWIAQGLDKDGNPVDRHDSVAGLEPGKKKRVTRVGGPFLHACFDHIEQRRMDSDDGIFPRLPAGIF